MAHCILLMVEGLDRLVPPVCIVEVTDVLMSAACERERHEFCCHSCSREENICGMRLLASRHTQVHGHLAVPCVCHLLRATLQLISDPYRQYLCTGASTSLCLLCAKNDRANKWRVLIVWPAKPKVTGAAILCGQTR